MNLSKMFCSFIAAGLLTFSHIAHAVVLDFGYLQAFDSAPFSQLALADINFETQFGQARHNKLTENDWVNWNISGLSDNRLTNLYSMVQGNGGEVSAPPATSASYSPEPESYAMIVAGLGLIVFTARHRK